MIVLYWEIIQYFRILNGTTCLIICYITLVYKKRIIRVWARGISELWSKGVWGPAMKSPNGVQAHFDRPGIKTTICKINNFLLLPVSALNTVIHNEVLPKTVVEKLSFSKLRIEKAKLSKTESQQMFCISVFNIKGCLTFGPFLTCGP